MESHHSDAYPDFKLLCILSCILDKKMDIMRHIHKNVSGLFPLHEQTKWNLLYHNIEPLYVSILLICKTSKKQSMDLSFTGITKI